MERKRGSGILLHITSLPSQFGMGDLGPAAYRFADFLCETRQRYWQILPVNPTNPACGHSPYSSTSAFAGNTLLISPEMLIGDGLLTQDDINKSYFSPTRFCEYEKSIAFKENIFARAYKNFKSVREGIEEYKTFTEENSSWLEDFALFNVIRKNAEGQMWVDWKHKLRDRNKTEIARIKREMKDDIEYEKFLQYVFFRQWTLLKRYCNERGISIIGDIPIYVSYDSADVWSNPEIFKLNEEKKPDFVSGVPPDYFSQTGQLWGNPVYNWEVLKSSEFKWWIERMKLNFKLFDIVRIDHFRGLVAYWEVPAGEKTAVNGKWADVPVMEFFDAMIRNFNHPHIIAEDLGIITADVKRVMAHYKFPGMKILLFAFNENNPFHPYLPHSYQRNWVVYTGTHDNNTVKGWFEKEASYDDKRRLFSYIGKEAYSHDVNWEFIRMAMMSVANIALFPMQDVLGMGEDCRMNKPSTVRGNWLWRLLPEEINSPAKHRLRELTEIYGRT